MFVHSDFNAFTLKNWLTSWNLPEKYFFFTESSDMDSPRIYYDFLSVYDFTKLRECKRQMLLSPWTIQWNWRKKLKKYIETATLLMFALKNLRNFLLIYSFLINFVTTTLRYGENLKIFILYSKFFSTIFANGKFWKSLVILFSFNVQVNSRLK